MILKDKIMSGALAPATMLKEEDLCRYFDVSRITIRRAMSDLAAEKLIERRQGVGSFVCKPPLSRRRINDMSFVDSLRESARDTEVEDLRQNPLYMVLRQRGVDFGRVIQQFSACVADPERSTHLDVGVGSPLLTLTRIIYDKTEKPVLWMTVCRPPDRSTMLMEVAGDNINTLNAGIVDCYL